MKAILTVLTLAASAYCQFRAFPVYLPQHLHRAHYDPCKPVTPHCAFVMHGGHYGPRTYDGDVPGIPPYTTYLENIEHAFYQVKHHITTYKNLDKPFRKEEEVRRLVNWQPLTQYVTILSAVKDLIDQVALNGEEFYPQFYEKTVLKTLREVSKNPVQATGRLWARMENFLEHISQIKAFIKQKQETKCKEPNSNECDIIIHFALHQSSDPTLGQQADLLAAGGRETEIFMKMTTLFEKKSNYNQAEDFLTNGAELLEPLVMAGFDTMKILEAIESFLDPPTQDAYVNNKKLSLEEILNQLVSFNSKEEEAIKAAQLTNNPSFGEKADAPLIASKKTDYMIQPNDNDDYLVYSIEKQDRVDKSAEKQDQVYNLAKNHDLDVPSEKQSPAVLDENQDHEVQLAKKQDLSVESAETGDRLQLTENRAHINEPAHFITQQDSKANSKYFEPHIIINLN